MKCIICFLKDGYQTKLRNIARLKSDRFESAIDEYKKLFTADFCSLDEVKDCPEHSNVGAETLDWCKDLYGLLLNVKDVSEWFDKIKETYKSWVGGCFSESLLSLGEMLDQHDMLEENNGSEYIFCIRGRKSKEVLTKEDLYHIPFNKRHLITNQRFSITGLPLLYLGLSPIDIMMESRSTERDLCDLYFSSFALKNSSSLTIANLTNKFPHLYSTFKGLHEVGSPVKLNDTIFSNLPKKCEAEFYKFILSSVCSFQVLERFEGSSFLEEYVLPQIFCERARQKGFDGISYSSTRVTNSHCYSNEVFHTNKYRENIVLFTRYSESDNHDLKLLDKFDISRPVRFAEMQEVSENEIEKLKKDIIELNNKTRKFSDLDMLSEYSGVRFNVHYGNLMIKDKKKDTPYKDHFTGKIHLFLLYQHMLSVRNWLKGA